MYAEVWKDFPSELHEHILQCCSVPELCTLRIVSRAWNDLVRHTLFASGAQLQNTYICILADDVDIGYNSTSSSSNAVNLRNSWQLMDLSMKKFFWVNKECSCLMAWATDFAYIMDFHRTMAEDKGPLCVLWSSRTLEVMQILNPVARSVIEVPLFQSSGDRRVIINAIGGYGCCRGLLLLQALLHRRNRLWKSMC